MAEAVRFRWRLVVGVTLGVGIAMGALIAALQGFFGIDVPTILGGVLAGVIIVVVLMLAGAGAETESGASARGGSDSEFRD